MIIDNLPDVIVRTMGWCMHDLQESGGRTLRSQPNNTSIIKAHAAEIITLSNGPVLQTAAQPKMLTYLANPIPSLGKKEAVKVHVSPVEDQEAHVMLSDSRSGAAKGLTIESSRCRPGVMQRVAQGCCH